MTLQTSGQISMGDIRAEIFGAGDSMGFFSLNDWYCRQLAGKPSGAIALTDFYGKTWETRRTPTRALSGSGYTEEGQTLEVVSPPGLYSNVMALYTWATSGPAYTGKIVIRRAFTVDVLYDEASQWFTRGGYWIAYSVNGGESYTTVETVDNENRALGTVEINLPTPVPIYLLKVRISSYATPTEWLDGVTRLTVEDIYFSTKGI